MKVTTSNNSFKGTAMPVAPKNIPLVGNEIDISMPSDRRTAQSPKYTGIQAFTIYLVAAWALLQLPVELIFARSSGEFLGSLAGRLVWVLLAIGANYALPLTRFTFFFLCGSSVIVLLVEFPTVFEASKLVSALCAVECLLKSLALMVCVIHKRLN